MVILRPRLFSAGTFAALAVMTCLPPVRSELLVPQAMAGSPQRTLWQRIFESIPSSLQPAHDVLVREVSDQEMDGLVRDGPDEAAKQDDSIVDGMFFVDEKKMPVITLRRSLAGQAAKQVFAHELGHVIWNTRLSSGQRRQYSATYRRSKEAKRLVTEYAAESVDEGFAEAFALFLLEPDNLRRRDPLASDFLEKFRAVGNSQPRHRPMPGPQGRPRGG